MLIVTGVQQTMRAFGRAVNGDGVRIAVALQNCGQMILDRSQEYVPRDTEALAATGRVHTTGRGFGARVRVEYGGHAPGYDVVVDYAERVHNDLTMRHDPPTQAMFLARATLELRPACAAEVRRQFVAADVEGVRGHQRTLPATLSGKAGTGGILPGGMRRGS